MGMHINVMCLSRNRIKNMKVSGLILMFKFFQIVEANCTACPLSTRKAEQMFVSLNSDSFCGKSGGLIHNKSRDVGHLRGSEGRLK